MKKYSLTIIFISALIFNFISGSTGWAAEPSVADYECVPIFSINAVQPNILIMLDNSGSMNFNAYGTYPGDGDIVRDQPYAGEPYNGRIGKFVKASVNDAQEISSVVTLTDTTLTLGESGVNSVTTGLRFTNIEIPQGKTIESAYIQFMASYTNTTASTYKIVGEAADNSAAFSDTAGDISGRTATTASVSGTAASWTAGTTYTADLTPIVQEIVNRTNWKSGNAMSFIITGTGTRRAHSYDSDPAKVPMLYIKYADAESLKYYGYFNPDYFYYWNSSKFDHKYKKVNYDETGGYWNVTDLSGTAMTLTDAEIVSEGLWDGNWMNWVSMRRLDVLRKVLMGGLQTARAGGGNQINYGETPNQTYRSFVRVFDSSLGSAVSPYDGTYYYGIGGGYIYVASSDIYVYTDKKTGLTLRQGLSSSWSGYLVKRALAIQKTIAYDPEDFDSTTLNLAGILDRVGVKARWGNEWFKSGSGPGGSGGFISHVVQDISSTTLITDLQNTGADTSTPLAEAYYVAVQYFKQEDPESGLDYANGVAPHANVGDDPYYDGQYVECAKSFVLMLTDGASTVDAMVPESLRDFDGDGKENYTTTTCAEAYGTTCDYADGGTDYLDDIALYARITDLRSDTVGKSELDGEQNLMLYTVLAFEEDINAVNLLSDAAKNGGFIDRNGNDRPDLDEEWDANGDGIPDTFYMASDGYKLQKELLKAINDILKRAASGTAVSVLATSGEGEGTLVQAYFRPTVPSGLEDINWVGYLQSLWVDDHGNLREDTNKNKILDIAEDNIVSYYLDPGSNETRVKLWYISVGNEYPDTSTVTQDEIRDMDEISPLWEGGKMLAERDPVDRSIFTYIDKDDDDVVDETTYNNLDTSGEMVTFDSTTEDLISPYLGVDDDSTWGYLGAAKADRVTNLISYIRGTDITGLRKRTMDDGTVWKLGDIVHSTPVSVSKPTDNYHIIYSDETFGTYYDTYKNRETIVYVGANDGMLHAFTAGRYNETLRQFEEVGGTSIGSEIWAYIPQALLPHLKWLPDIGYSHVYYVDLKPKIFDAQYDYNGDGDLDDWEDWRTILILGLNLGGGKIDVTDDFDYKSASAYTTREFASSYTCMDVTDPRNPIVLWERSYPDLELTTSYPSPVRVKDKWFVVFGSGPNAEPNYNCDCTSAKYGHIFIVDLETGDPYEAAAGSGWLYETAENKAFMSAPVSVDKDLNFNVDAIYIGETYDSANWVGKIYKIPVPWLNSSGDYDGSDVNNYSDDPTVWGPYIYSFFDSPGPITSSAALSVDALDNLWVYAGTGRYLSNSDKSDTNQQYIFGIRDPFYNKKYTGSYYHDYSVSASYELTTSNLLFSDPFYVNKDTYEVLKDISLPLDGDPDESIGGWSDLLDLARAEDGWYRNLSIAYERVMTKFSILGGIVFAPTFVPTDDICGFGGDSYLYGVYYETGTSYYKPIFCEGERTTYYTGTGTDITTIADKTSIGYGMTSNIGVHVGKEGAKGFIQTSTGTIEEVDINPGAPIKSGLMSWIEK